MSLFDICSSYVAFLYFLPRGLITELNNHVQNTFDIVNDLAMVAALKQHPWMYCASC